MHGYVLVYSINSTKSFEVIQTLYDKIVDQVGNPKLPVILVGNKKDLEHEREVSKEEGEKLAKDLKAAFLETSAKDNLCVCDLFQVDIRDQRKLGTSYKKCVFPERYPANRNFEREHEGRWKFWQWMSGVLETPLAYCSLQGEST